MEKELKFKFNVGEIVKVVDIGYKGQIKLVAVNHKKKQVIIRWNDGTKTKATCNEKDDFDIKVGFAIAFTRKFFKNDEKLERYITLKRPKNNSKVVEKEESKPEQFDLKKELERWGLKPNRRFKVTLLHMDDISLSFNADYFINKRNILCFYEKDMSTYKICEVTAKELILKLINGLVKIKFLDNLDNIDNLDE